ncbi:hypothetical protein CDO51_01725 [Natranaerobius trueperi]|uniref:Uncharacterized protein n=1 Tax=Natranaerobius trueperi TaxID=759412 RepID=A0A226C2C7_9FIRM|nr:hypothetical protein CDO51_01725 [Natranaerobius trueperi]
MMMVTASWDLVGAQYLINREAHSGAPGRNPDDVQKSFESERVGFGGLTVTRLDRPKGIG